MRFLTLLLLATAAIGQEARFEAAAVKPAAFAVDDPAMQGPNDASMYSAAGLSLRRIISDAYDTPTINIDADVHRFPFVRSAIYSISAKIPAGVGRDRIPEMLKGLLTERFGLVCHTEQRTVKGFLLVLTNLNNLKTNAVFTEYPRPPSWHEVNGPQLWAMYKVTSMSKVARLLTNVTGRPVIDKTGGIDGQYTMWFEAGEPGLTPELIQSLDWNGLKLQPGDVTVAYLVIDKLNKTPNEE